MRQFDRYHIAGTHPRSAPRSEHFLVGRTTLTLMLKSIASAESDSNGLESMPFEMIVHVAESAEAAIGKLYAHRIDLAFVDIQLPGKMRAYSHLRNFATSHPHVAPSQPAVPPASPDPHPTPIPTPPCSTSLPSLRPVSAVQVQTGMS